MISPTMEMTMMKMAMLTIMMDGMPTTIRVKFHNTTMEYMLVGLPEQPATMASVLVV